MYFRVNEFEVGVNDSIFCSNEQQKVYNALLIPDNFISTLHEKFLKPLITLTKVTVTSAKRLFNVFQKRQCTFL